jgi:hypothetical protein
MHSIKKTVICLSLICTTRFELRPLLAQSGQVLELKVRCERRAEVGILAYPKVGKLVTTVISAISITGIV